jgi:hypothetical protein
VRQHTLRPASRALLAGGLTALLAVLGGCATDAPGLRGQLVAIDDTGLPDQPLERGWIAALPGTVAAGVWPDVPTGDDDLRYLSQPLDADRVERVGGVLAPVGRGGEFTLDVPPGLALVCWVDGTLDDLRTSGCSSTELPEDGGLRLTWGEGGLGLEIPS